MKKLMAIIGVMICHTVPAQNTFHYFNKSYDFNNYYETTWSVRIAGDTIITVAAYSGSGLQGINFAFVDGAGDLIAEKQIYWPGQYPYPGLGASLTPVKSGGYFLTGSTSDSTNNQMFLTVRYNEAGDTLWTRTFDFGFDDIGYTGCQGINGDFIMAGVSDSLDGTGDVLMVCTDSLGNLKWRKYFGNSGLFETCLKVINCPDGGYLLACSKETFIGDYQTWIIKSDNVGEIVWEKKIGGPYDEGIAGIACVNEGYIISYFHGDTGDFWKTKGQLRVLFLDSLGVEQWNKRMGPVNVEGWSAKMVLTKGGFLVGGSINEDDIGFLARFNYQGDSLWFRKYYYHSFGIHYLRDVVSTPEGGFIAAGVCFPPQDRWLFSVDSCGCLFPGCDPNCNLSVGVNEETIGQITETTLKVYPNPSAGVVYFSSILPDSEGLLLIYDLTGKEINRIPVSQGSVQVIFDGSLLPAGVYIARLLNGKGETHDARKFIIGGR